MRPIAVAILVLVLASVYAAPVSAANITITFDKEQLQAKMILSVHQNMTSFPNQMVTLDGSRDTNISSAFNEALRKVAGSASFSALTLGVASNPAWLNLTITMGVTGVTERQGDIAAANMTWKAFNVSADLRAGDLSYNKAGTRYLRPVLAFYENASRFETNPNATIKAVTFFVSGNQSVPGTLAANQLGNFTVLNFSSLNVPLEQWNRTYSLSNNTTSWRYAPPAMLNASVRIQELNKTFTISSRYAYTAEVTVTGLAQAQGNMLREDIGSGQREWIMTGVVVLAVALAIVVQIMFRRRRKAVRLGRR